MKHCNIMQIGMHLIVFIIEMYVEIIVMRYFMSGNMIVVGISSLWPSMK